MSCMPRILFIDAYDSFSHNIIALIEEICGVKVTKIHIDAVILDFPRFVSQFIAVVCGPGPGHPAICQDVGLFKNVWTLPDDQAIPVLGICLGFQSLCYEFGASVTPLPEPRHGIRTKVTSSSTSIFAGLPEIYTVQYHSLHARLGTHPDDEPASTHLWKSGNCPQLQPLAWELGCQASMDARFKANPSPILMAVKHVDKPFYGIQFHPESICSDRSAQQVIVNWWQQSLAWWKTTCLSSPDSQNFLQPGSLQLHKFNSQFKFNDGSGHRETHLYSAPKRINSSHSSKSASKIYHTARKPVKLFSKTISTGSLEIPAICKALNLFADDVIILDSEMRQIPQLGVSSIIGILSADSIRLRYSVGSNTLLLQQGKNIERINLKSYGGSVFKYIKSFMSCFAITTDSDRAFCGGLMGYVNYEACLETIGVDTPALTGKPDICFAFVERSIVIDHRQQLVHIQGLHMDSATGLDTLCWVDSTCKALKALSREDSVVCTPLNRPCSLPNEVIRKNSPDHSGYVSKISRCQEKIRTGDSYELCLTDQSSVSLPGGTSAWDMYLQLRRLNPATFAAYVRLGPLTLLSTSPERFMSWSRFQPSSTKPKHSSPNKLVSTCQFRPIKGTVRKTLTRPDGSIHHVTRDEARAILKTQKEQAENLMIVDLIRHDLYGVCRDVSVPGLMVVEEYESVFQLVSVIEGKLYKPHGRGSSQVRTRHHLKDKGKHISGIDCLAASLPPGSMTGAPKKRSCQLLREIENEKPRSVYSGVLGYICVTGKGDFSVLIRSMYKWDGDGDSTWNIGAGGAVTALSTEEGEWEEMLTKLQSTYRLFEPGSG